MSKLETTIVFSCSALSLLNALRGLQCELWSIKHLLNYHCTNVHTCASIHC